MAAVPTSPSVSPLTARRTWRTLEPVHGMIYFAPEAARSYRALGIAPGAGYFASRSAPMGAVGADTVIATFFNFAPHLVQEAIPAAWRAASPGQVIEARTGAADAALRRILGDDVDSAGMVRAAGPPNTPPPAPRAARSSPPTPAWSGPTHPIWCCGTPRPSCGSSGGTGTSPC